MRDSRVKSWHEGRSMPIAPLQVNRVRYMSPPARRTRSRRASANANPKKRPAKAVRQSTAAMPQGVVAISSTDSSWRWRIVDGANNPVTESTETLTIAALALAAGNRHLRELKTPNTTARRRHTLNRVASPPLASAPVNNVRVVLTAPIEADSPTEDEMDVALARLSSQRASWRTIIAGHRQNSASPHVTFSW